jgi:hypothetical protein
MVYFNSNQAISFRYETGDFIGDGVVRRSVVCELVDVDTSGAKPVTKLASMGRSICHPKDSFCKETGRKRALADALNAGNYGILDRKIIWNAYLNRSRGEVVSVQHLR